MDRHTELCFLQELEKEKHGVLSKDQSKTGRQKRNDAWNRITTETSLICGKDFTVMQLTKKWQNLQSKVKEKIRHNNATGGGKTRSFDDSDDFVRKILGESNPTLAMVPGAVYVGMPNSTPEPPSPDHYELTDVTDTPVRTNTTPTSLVDIPLHKRPRDRELFSPPPSKKKQTKVTEDGLVDEVLLLEKEKLILEIAELKKRAACDILSLQREKLILEISDLKKAVSKKDSSTQSEPDRDFSMTRLLGHESDFYPSSAPAPVYQYHTM